MDARRSGFDWQRISATTAAALFVLFGGVSLTAAQTTGESSQTPDESSSTADPTPSSKAGESDMDDERTLRERVMLKLSGYHYDPSARPFDSWDADVEGTLRALAGERGLRPSLRTRAVDTLGFYDSDETTAFLKGLLSLPDEELGEEEREARETLRHHAIEALARQLDDDRAVAVLEKFLDVDDLQLCLTAVHALGEHAGQSGTNRLQSFYADVDHDVVRDELATYVDGSERE